MKFKVTLFALIATLSFASINVASAASQSVCLKGSKVLNLPSSGKCPSGYKKVAVDGGKTTNAKKACTSAELYTLQDLRDSYLEAQEQVELWSDEAYEQQRLVSEYKIRGKYIESASAQQEANKAKSEVSAWTRTLTKSKSDFQAIEKKCINTSITLQ